MNYGTKAQGINTGYAPIGFRTDLRDYYAGQALTGILAGRFDKSCDIRTLEEFAFVAFELADAMLAERKA